MRRKKVPSKKLDAFKTMPPLFHKLPNEDYDHSRSEISQWLVEQSEILDWIRESAKRWGLIEYDSETQKWNGVDYD